MGTKRHEVPDVVEERRNHELIAGAGGQRQARGLEAVLELGDGFPV